MDNMSDLGYECEQRFCTIDPKGYPKTKTNDDDDGPRPIAVESNRYSSHHNYNLTAHPIWNHVAIQAIPG